MQKIKKTSQPVFSDGFKGIDNIDRIAIAVTIVNIIKNKKVQILYEPNRNKIFVNADKIRLAQDISNLLDNALKFTQEEFIIITTIITKQKK